MTKSRLTVFPLLKQIRFKNNLAKKEVVTAYQGEYH